MMCELPQTPEVDVSFLFQGKVTFQHPQLAYRLDCHWRDIQEKLLKSWKLISSILKFDSHSLLYSQGKHYM